MRKFAGIFLLLIVVSLVALPVFAQGSPAGAAKPPEHVATGIVFAAGLSMAIAAAFCGSVSRAWQRPPAKDRSQSGSSGRNSFGYDSWPGIHRDLGAFHAGHCLRESGLLVSTK